jgi:hypothetical protein
VLPTERSDMGEQLVGQRFALGAKLCRAASIGRVPRSRSITSSRHVAPSRRPAKPGSGRSTLYRDIQAPDKAMLQEPLATHQKAFAVNLDLAKYGWLALAWANSPWAGSYSTLWEHKFTIGFEGFALSKSILHWKASLTTYWERNSPISHSWVISRASNCAGRLAPNYHARFSSCSHSSQICAETDRINIVSMTFAQELGPHSISPRFFRLVAQDESSAPDDDPGCVTSSKVHSKRFQGLHHLRITQIPRSASTKHRTACGKITWAGALHTGVNLPLGSPWVFPIAYEPAPKDLLIDVKRLGEVFYGNRALGGRRHLSLTLTLSSPLASSVNLCRCPIAPSLLRQLSQCPLRTFPELGEE